MSVEKVRRGVRASSLSELAFLLISVRKYFFLVYFIYSNQPPGVKKGEAFMCCTRCFEIIYFKLI